MHSATARKSKSPLSSSATAASTGFIKVLYSDDDACDVDKLLITSYWPIQHSNYCFLCKIQNQTISLTELKLQIYEYDLNTYQTWFGKYSSEICSDCAKYCFYKTYCNVVLIVIIKGHLNLGFVFSYKNIFSAIKESFSFFIFSSSSQQ